MEEIILQAGKARGALINFKMTTESAKAKLNYISSAQRLFYPLYLTMKPGNPVLKILRMLSEDKYFRKHPLMYVMNS